MKKTEAPIEIVPPKFSYVIVTIQGESPLYQNRMTEESLDKIEEKQAKAAKTALPPRDPEREFMAKAHVIGQPTLVRESFGKNRFGIPAIAFKKCIATAAMRYNDEKRNHWFGLFQVHGPHRGLVEIKCSEPYMARDWGKPSGAGTTLLIYRPVFESWSVDLPIRYVSSMLTVDKLVNAIHWAGISIGIGSWRTENGGDKGAFRIAQVKEYSESDFKSEMERRGGKPIDGSRRFDNRAADRTAGNGSRRSNSRAAAGVR